MKITYFKHTIVIFLSLISCMMAVAQDIVVHDPVVIKADNDYYLYCTGNGCFPLT